MFLNSPWLPPLLSPSPELWDEVGFHLSKLSTGWSSRSLEQPYWFCQRPTQPWEALTRVPPWRSWHPWPRPNCPWQGRRSPWDQKVPNTRLVSPACSCHSKTPSLRCPHSLIDQNKGKSVAQLEEDQTEQEAEDLLKLDLKPSNLEPPRQGL